METTERADEQLDVGRIAHVKVQRGTNGAGQDVYRHVLITDWQVIPNV